MTEYVELAKQVEEKYDAFNSDNLPAIENYVPRSGFTALCQPDKNMFGKPDVAIDMLKKMKTMMGRKVKPYKLYLVDDHALWSDPLVFQLVGSSETVMVVGGQQPDGDDFNCGGLCSRRGRDFVVQWSTARSTVAHAEQLFERLRELSSPPRKVTTRDISEAINKLGG